MSNRLLVIALQYREIGMSIIPVGNNKRPLVKWLRYQEERASKDQIIEWWKKYPEANIGIVTGAISELAVIDIDDVKAAQDVLNGLIPDSLIIPTVNTPSEVDSTYTLNVRMIR